MDLAVIIVTGMTGLLMGLLSWFAWRNKGARLFGQVAVAVLGAGTAVDTFITVQSPSLGWRNAVIIGALGALALSILANLAALHHRRRMQKKKRRQHTDTVQNQHRLEL